MMNEADKTREQLITENTALRQRLAALEAAAAKHKRVEEALQTSERRYRHWMQHSLGLLCVHDLDGVLLEVNAAAAQALGYRPEDGVGKSLRAFLAPSVQQEFKAYLERIRRQPTDSGLLRVVTRMGEERVWLYRNVRYAESDTPPYVLGHALDVTERVQAEQELKQVQADLEQRVAVRTAQLQRINAQLQAEITERRRVEEELRHSEAHFRSLVQNASDIIALFELDGTVRYYSPSIERVLGYCPDELIGRNVFGAIHPEDVARVKDAMTRLVQHPGLTQDIELRLWHREGTWRDFDAVGSSPLDDLSAGCIVVNARDITERKQAEADRLVLEAQLRQSQKMEAIGTLAGGIAHEFNNILAVMIGYTEMATYDLPPTHPVSHNLQEVLTAGRRAKDLVQQILTFSRPSNLDRQLVQVSRLVQEGLKWLRATLPTTIEIHLHIAEEAGTVLADPTQLHQILMNLGSNVDYALRETGGIMEISVDPVEVDTAFAAAHPELQSGPHVRLRIHDTGPGMPPDVVERIFEPFFTTKGVGEGTGMGLAIVHGIVTRYGGAMTVESTPGAGTTFAIYLPRLADTVASDPIHPEEGKPQGKGRILFVDDENLLARLGQEMLERLGYEVVSCTSAIEALAAFQAEPHHFDLVITDQTMPHMTGDRLARELRRLRADIPIILCTGFSHVIDATKAQAMGLDAFCMKPLMTRDLAVTIQQVLGQRSDQET